MYKENNDNLKNQSLNKLQIKNLLKLSNHLDAIGKHTEADYIDAILKKQAFLGGLGGDLSIEDILSQPLVLKVIGAGWDELQQQAARWVMQELGAEEGSFGSDFIANIFANLDAAEVVAMLSASKEELCTKISREVTEAFQKTLLEINITGRVEKVFETAINTLMGFSPGGVGADFVDFVVNDAFAKSMEETLTTYLTQNNVISVKTSEYICAATMSLIGHLALQYPQVMSALGISEEEAKEMMAEVDIGGFFDSVSSGFETVQEIGEDGIEFITDMTDMFTSVPSPEEFQEMAKEEAKKFLEEADEEIKEELKKQLVAIGEEKAKELLGPDAFKAAKDFYNLFE